MSVRVTPEGRDGVWVPDLDDLVSWLSVGDEPVHCFIDTPVAFLGADWEREAVVADVQAAERVALLTGDAKRQNLGHALAVIRDDKLRMFDIGDVEAVIEVSV